MTTPTLEVDGETVELHNESDLQDAFIHQSGFKPGEQFDEWEVDTIDCIIDYDHNLDQTVLQVYVYFNSILEDTEITSMGVISDELLSVDGWERNGNMLGNNRFGIEYEKRLSE